jgi:hypothetical protein
VRAERPPPQSGPFRLYLPTKYLEAFLVSFAAHLWSNIDGRMTERLGTTWKEAVVPESRLYSGTFVEGLREIMINVRESKRCPGRDSSQEPPKYR